MPRCLADANVDSVWRTCFFQARLQRTPTEKTPKNRFSLWKHDSLHSDTEEPWTNANQQKKKKTPQTNKKKNREQNQSPHGTRFGDYHREASQLLVMLRFISLVAAAGVWVLLSFLLQTYFVNIFVCIRCRFCLHPSLKFKLFPIKCQQDFVRTLTIWFENRYWKTTVHEFSDRFRKKGKLESWAGGRVDVAESSIYFKTVIIETVVVA